MRNPLCDRNISHASRLRHHDLESFASLSTMGEQSSAILRVMLDARCNRDEYQCELRLLLERSGALVSKLDQRPWRSLYLLHNLHRCHVLEYSISAASFSAFSGGYSTFLDPITGIMLSNLWILRRRHLSLYRHPDIYSYFDSFKIRAFVAFICGIAPNLPGLDRATGNLSVPKGATYVIV